MKKIFPYPKADKPNSYGFPFVTNQRYNVNWNYGIDFTYIWIEPSNAW